MRETIETKIKVHQARQVRGKDKILQLIALEIQVGQTGQTVGQSQRGQYAAIHVERRQIRQRGWEEKVRHRIYAEIDDPEICQGARERDVGEQIDLKMERNQV